MADVVFFEGENNQLIKAKYKSHNGYFTFAIDENGKEWKLDNDYCVIYVEDDIPSESEIRDDLDDNFRCSLYEY